MIEQVRHGRKDALGNKGRTTAYPHWLKVALCLVTFALGSLPGLAVANELDDFQQALRAYDGQDYALSATLFESLVGGEYPRLQNRALVLESRKYLAASYLFIGRRPNAAQQFERLLREDPTYQLDPLAFPEEVQKTFGEARKKLEQERIAAEELNKRAQTEAFNKKNAETQEDRDKLHRVFVLAQTEQVERVHSRWIAMVPFGAGQFQNGDSGWGTFFAVSEGLTAAASIVSFIFHDSLRGQQPAQDDLDDASFAESAFRYTNQVSIVLLAAFVVAGIIDAQIRYTPFERENRQRPLPEELRNLMKVSIEAGGVSARLSL